jgi:hypothetical protein
MRLWTLHPRYLDPQGLVALWREALLAQAVLAGATRGYKHHPQLQRFRDCRRPIAAIGAYLEHVRREAVARGYGFDATRILEADTRARLRAQRGQLLFERRHLAGKLTARHPAALPRLQRGPLAAHPMFRIVAGGVADWERAHPGAEA